MHFFKVFFNLTVIRRLIIRPYSSLEASHWDVWEFPYPECPTPPPYLGGSRQMSGEHKQEASCVSEWWISLWGSCTAEDKWLGPVSHVGSLWRRHFYWQLLWSYFISDRITYFILKWNRNELTDWLFFLSSSTKYSWLVILYFSIVHFPL